MRHFLLTDDLAGGRPLAERCWSPPAAREAAPMACCGAAATPAGRRRCRCSLCPPQAGDDGHCLPKPPASLQLQASGNIAAWQEASVGAGAGPAAASVNVNIGDVVKKSQVLATRPRDHRSRTCRARPR
jgi:multidrug efflux pump subunit AcrA (membrane-fusion protein)